MKKEQNTNPFDLMRVNEGKDNLEEYPLYPESEDIYNRFKEEPGLDPEDTSKTKTSTGNDELTSEIEEGIGKDNLGSDLDVPGSELDDEQEMIGSEDEENNYYSLGGDDHNDLDEDKDELQTRKVLPDSLMSYQSKQPTDLPVTWKKPLKQDVINILQNQKILQH